MANVVESLACARKARVGVTVDTRKGGDVWREVEIAKTEPRKCSLVFFNFFQRSLKIELSVKIDFTLSNYFGPVHTTIG